MPSHSLTAHWDKFIASLLASGTEILYGLGLGSCVVAISHDKAHEKIRQHEKIDRLRGY